MSTDPSEIRGFELLQTVAAQALDDEDYRRRLLDDPRSVLREAGLVVPDEIDVVIHENTSDRVHLVLPAGPQAGRELDIEEVDVVRLAVMTHF